LADTSSRETGKHPRVQASVAGHIFFYQNIFPIARRKTGSMKLLHFLLAAVIAGGLIGAGCVGSPEDTRNPPPTSSVNGTIAQMETSMGNITLVLYADMPVTAGNFEKLARQGYYDGVTFHRVIDGFMIQGGDPTGTGRGGPGYTIPDEFVSSHHNIRGTIAMANAGPDTGGSQFFINLVDNVRLDPKHPVFGEVIAGMNVVDRIGKVKTDSNDRPLQNVNIYRVSILEP
jgi:peptidylprolyl isomerase